MKHDRSLVLLHRGGTAAPIAAGRPNSKVGLHFISLRRISADNRPAVCFHHLVKIAPRIIVAALATWLVLTTSIVTCVTWSHPKQRAVLGMGWGLVLLWIALGGTVMFKFRKRICHYVARVPVDWRVKFILFATILALVEEAITTSMTNLAPLFGVKAGEAYITASANYLDVVALHSVIMFIPMFIGWALILWRFSFSPFAVFILFGLTGTLVETRFGLKNPLEFGLWIFVYGLMVYLPAYCVPPERGARNPRWWHYPSAVLAPLIFVALVPLRFLLGFFFPNHPDIHFPPIGL